MRCISPRIVELAAIYRLLKCKFQDCRRLRRLTVNRDDFGELFCSRRNCRRRHRSILYLACNNECAFVEINCIWKVLELLTHYSQCVRGLDNLLVIAKLLEISQSPDERQNSLFSLALRQSSLSDVPPCLCE